MGFLYDSDRIPIGCMPDSNETHIVLCGDHGGLASRDDCGHACGDACGDSYGDDCGDAPLDDCGITIGFRVGILWRSVGSHLDFQFYSCWIPVGFLLEFVWCSCGRVH